MTKLPFPTQGAGIGLTKPAPVKTLHFHFYDAGAYDGETEHRIMCSFYSVTDGAMRPGQSELVLSSQWPAFRAHIERNGWTCRVPTYGSK